MQSFHSGLKERQHQAFTAYQAQGWILHRFPEGPRRKQVFILIKETRRGRHLAECLSYWLGCQLPVSKSLGSSLAPIPYSSFLLTGTLGDSRDVLSSWVHATHKGAAD